MLPAEQQRVAAALEDDAELMSNTQLEVLVGQPSRSRKVIRINTDARPLALQVALMIPILAALIGLINSFRMVRMPEPIPSASVEGWPSAERSPGDRRCHSCSGQVMDERDSHDGDDDDRGRHDSRRGRIGIAYRPMRSANGWMSILPSG